MSLYSNLLPVPSGILEVASSPVCYTEEIVTSSLQFSLIIPTYNEGENVQEIVKILSQLLDSIIPGEYELIVVDDNSPDGTWKLAQELTIQYPQLRVMRREQEKGLSTAVIRGWQVARGKILGVIDADLQHPPEILLQLWQEMVQGADLAVASRHVEGGGVSEWSVVRRFLSRGAQMLGLIILPEVIGRLSDPMSGYFMVRRDAIVGKPLSPVGYKILIEVTGRGKIRWIGEVGYVFRERQAGASKVTWKQYIEYIQHLLRLRFDLWPVKRFLRFGVVGFSGVFVDLGVFYVLRTVLGLALTRSAILSSEVAIINNFLWNDLWTFGDISSRQKGMGKRIKRLLKFNVVCLTGLVLNVLLVNFLFNVLGVNEYLAKLIAIAAVTLWNFWFNLKLSWRVTDAQK
ncbi:Dolichyl-phosphate beta-D-mannosyltransferase [Stanieria cyanosphaera PCC 7437]|uniref:Dolichol-phosphate mannosyltransferase n=1 Tax=Stanieria cyanosphaera (strain ATCC 29371 / PCC 7437) TaxID=111780 RepID=K9XZQ6_STAC7|nr:glycosyltransferase [Stanieria cyanosphaera]AFZ37596.1 Dolichyl-phosphate beta-D-mannosyltransferase [Stanieria cyanosphaera PCC 7437]